MTAFEIADWRRRVFAMYARVRASTDLVEAHDFWRRTRDDLFATHPASPLLPDDRPDFSGLVTAPYDPAWRFNVVVQADGALLGDAVTTRRMDVETGTDGIVPFELLGVARVPGVGTLDVWRLASYGGGIFVPLRDSLAGKPRGTYGGGRYLIDTVKGADLGPGVAPDSLVLDFNFAYNPSCAYDPAWACPLPQAGNRVAVEISVGERQPY